MAAPIRIIHPIGAVLIAASLAAPACSPAGDGGDPGAALDTCALLTAAEARTAAATREPIAPQNRSVSVGEIGGSRVTVDRCEYRVPVREGHPGNSNVKVTVTDQPWHEFVDRLTAVPDLGDRAVYDAGRPNATIYVRHGETQLILSFRRDRDAGEAGDGDDAAPPRRLVTAARQALARLPDDPRIPGLAAKGPCANVDRKAIADLLGSAPAYSRSIEGTDRRLCLFTTKTNRHVTAVLDGAPHGDRVVHYQRKLPRVQSREIQAYWEYGRMVVVGGRSAMYITVPAWDEGDTTTGTRRPSARRTPAFVGFAVAAAKAYGLKSRTLPQPDVGTDPCSLLTPEEAGRLDYFGSERVPHPVVDRSVWIYGRNVPVASCGYDNRTGTVRADQRPAVEVQISARTYDPIADDEQFERDRIPVEGLGDRAHYVFDSDETWLTVERGGRQLTVHAGISHIDRSRHDDAKIRSDVEQVARSALARLPDTVEIKADAAAEPCSDAARPISAAMGGDLRFSRSTVSEWTASCAYTTADGTTAIVDVQYGMPADSIARRLGRGDRIGTGEPEMRNESDLVTVAGRTSVLTVHLHRSGERAFPMEYGGVHLAVARAAAVLLDR